MTIVVTGASGLVGTAICNWFLSKNYFVIGLVNHSRSEIRHVNFSEQIIDLVNSPLTIANGAEVNFVVHCAAIIPGKNSAYAAEEIYDLNQKIDKNVFSFCEEHQTKLFYFSTAYLCSGTENGILDEKSPVNNNLQGYYLSKWHNEMFLDRSDLNYCICRISSPYGNIDKQTNVIKIFAAKIKEGLPVTFINNGERQQNFIHVDDIAKGCYLGMDKDLKGTYNLVFSRSYSMLELATYIKEILNSGSDFNFDKTITEKARNVNFSNSKLKMALNWEPSLDLRAGLLKTLRK